MKHINMEEFANGAFTVQVNRAMEKVMKNIQDPNTDAKATRKITVTIAFINYCRSRPSTFQGKPLGNTGQVYS